jgi:hypothetical protein
MTAVLESIRLDSPAKPTQVDPGDFESTANAFAAQQTAMNDIMVTLRSDLAANMACIGKDHSAQSFAGSYRSASATVMSGLAQLGQVVGDIAQGLAQSGTDHSRADAISAGNWQSLYATISVTTMDTLIPQVVPEIAGHEPGWLPSVLDQVWPTYDAGKLAGTANAWHTAAESADAVRDSLHGALTALVDNNSGDDLNALNQFWDQFVNGVDAIFPALDTAINAIAAGVTAYGQMVDQVQDQLNEAVAEAALEALGSGLVDIVADLLTDGAAALLSGPEGEAIAAAAVDRINAVCQILLGALRASAAIQNISVEGDTALSRAIQGLPKPAVVKDDSWQVGDDIMPANSTRDRGKFEDGEPAIADYLTSRGHVVMALPAKGQGIAQNSRNPDSLVDGEPVEFKTLDPASTAKTITNQLSTSEKNGGQAPAVFVDAQNASPPITAGGAQEALQAFYQGTSSSPPRSKGVVQQVTVLLQGGGRVTWPPGYGGL